MKRNSWIQIMVAAAIIIAAGAALALAENLAITIKKTGDDQVVAVAADGTTEEVRLADLADGQQRSWTAGDTEVVVTRRGDDLDVTLDGEPVTIAHAGKGASVWVGEDGGVTDLGCCDHKVMFIAEGDDATVVSPDDVKVWRSSDGTAPEEIEVIVERLREQLGEEGANGDQRVLVFHGEGEGEPVMIQRFIEPGKVRYRCAETGSELVLAAEDAVNDSYVDPATGCLMEKVTTPERQVIKVIQKVSKDSEPAE